MPVEATIAKARNAMQAGDLRRAKEILRSSLGNYGYSPPLFQAYGEVLLALNERKQAGRYFFFSIANPEDDHRNAIEAFLADHSKGGYKSILLAAPATKVSKLSGLPDFARTELEKLGAPEDLSRLYAAENDWWLKHGCLAVLVIIAGLVIIGLQTVIKWIFG